MAVASVSTITAASPVGWQDAAERARAEDGMIIQYLVTMQVIFVLEDPE